MPFSLIVTVILLVLTPPDNAKVTNTSPDDSDPLKLNMANSTINTTVGKYMQDIS